MIDFHTHILPSMDDGSNSIETSKKMLEEIENDGVEVVCLTSHYYSFFESIDKFIERRNEAFAKLNYQGKLKLKLGSEIRYYDSMAEDENIGKLCLEGTNILLIELPLFGSINDNIIYDILRLKNRGFDIVLAHIERYKIKEQTLDYLYKSDIKFQLNTRPLLGYFTRKNALKLVKNGYISYLGSDCHNLKERAPFFQKAISKLKETLGDDLNSYIDGLNNLVIDETNTNL